MLVTISGRRPGSGLEIGPQQNLVRSKNIDFVWKRKTTLQLRIKRRARTIFCGQTVQGTHAGFRTVGERAGQNLSPLARLATQRSTSTHAFSAVDRDTTTFRNNRRFNISPFAFVGVILDLAHDGVMYVNHTPRPGHRHLQGTVG